MKFNRDAPRESDDDVEQDSSVEESDPPQPFQSVVPEDARDGIAEPIYHLIGEVFELRGVFGWLRRTLVTFAQITYGRTLNRYPSIHPSIHPSHSSIHLKY